VIKQTRLTLSETALCVLWQTNLCFLERRVSTRSTRTMWETAVERRVRCRTGWTHVGSSLSSETQTQTYK